MTNASSCFRHCLKRMRRPTYSDRRIHNERAHHLDASDVAAAVMRAPDRDDRNRTWLRHNGSAGGAQWIPHAIAECGINGAIIVASDDAVQVRITVKPGDTFSRGSAEVGVNGAVVVAGDLAVEVEIAEVRVLTDDRVRR